MPVWRGEPFPHRSSSDTALRDAGLDPGVDEDLRAFPGHGGRGAQIVAITDSSGASNPCGGPSAAPHPTSTRRLNFPTEPGLQGPALVVSVVVFVGCDQSNHVRERRDVEYLTKRARREDTTIGVTNDRTQRIARPAPAES